MLCVETVEKSKKSNKFPPDLSPAALKALALAVENEDSIYELEIIAASLKSDLMLHTTAVLDMNGIMTIADLLSKTVHDLLAIPNIGSVAVREIFHCLAHYDKLDKLKIEFQKGVQQRECLARLIRTHCPGKHGKFTTSKVGV